MDRVLDVVTIHFVYLGLVTTLRYEIKGGGKSVLFSICLYFVLLFVLFLLFAVLVNHFDGRSVSLALDLNIDDGRSRDTLRRRRRRWQQHEDLLQETWRPGKHLKRKRKQTY